jgi:hypothetical protein
VANPRYIDVCLKKPEGQGMSDRKRQATIFFLAALAGCSLPQACGPANTRAEMIGMSADEISTCLGPPENKTVEGGVEKVFYKYDSCAVRLELVSGRVVSVSYSVPRSESLTTDEQCSKVPIVASCLRWLRSPTLSGAK